MTRSKFDKSEKYRAHVLPRDERRSAIDLVVLLLGAAKCGTAIHVVTSDGQSAEIGPAVHELMLDAISLLAASDRAFLFALDGNRRHTPGEFIPIVGQKATEGLQGSARGTRESGKSGAATYYELAPMLEALTRSLHRAGSIERAANEHTVEDSQDGASVRLAVASCPGAGATSPTQ